MVDRLDLSTNIIENIVNCGLAAGYSRQQGVGGDAAPGRPARARPRTAAAGSGDAAGGRNTSAIFPVCTLVSSATLREHVTDH